MNIEPLKKYKYKKYKNKYKNRKFEVLFLTEWQDFMLTQTYFLDSLLVRKLLNKCRDKTSHDLNFKWQSIIVFEL